MGEFFILKQIFLGKLRQQISYDAVVMLTGGEQTVRTRLIFRSITVTGVSATTLTFSTAPGAQTKAAA